MPISTEQIELCFETTRERDVAFGFLERIEPNGWMTAPVEGVALAQGVPLTLAESVLRRLQGFEPTGIFARSLSECLMLQAAEEGAPSWELTALIENLPLLADGRLAELAELCDCEPEDIPEIAAELKRFDPKPGLQLADDRAPLVPPDLSVRKSDGVWTVELNRSTLPSIKIAPDTPAQTVETEARAYRMRALSEARWLASTLRRRQTTLLQTATAIVARQNAFLERGPSAMQPLSLADIGEALELHSSTISRAIAGRMIDTPIGAIPLKSFLSRAFPGGSEGEASSQDAVLDLVRRIVEGEDSARPLSDTAIAGQAARHGVKIARRTVAKFRGLLGIASSYARRKNPAPA